MTPSLLLWRAPGCTKIAHRHSEAISHRRLGYRREFRKWEAVFCPFSSQRNRHSDGYYSDILFPLQPPPLPIPTNPPGRPTREGLISVHFGSVWLRSAPFGSVWLCFGSVPGPFRVRFGGVGLGRGGVGERGFCKGKEYH